MVVLQQNASERSLPIATCPKDLSFHCISSSSTDWGISLWVYYSIDGDADYFFRGPRRAFQRPIFSELVGRIHSPSGIDRPCVVLSKLLLF